MSFTHIRYTMWRATLACLLLAASVSCDGDEPAGPGDNKNNHTPPNDVPAVSLTLLSDQYMPPWVACARWAVADTVSDKIWTRWTLVECADGDCEEELAQVQADPDAQAWSDWALYEEGAYPWGDGIPHQDPPVVTELLVIQAKDDKGEATSTFEFGENAARVTTGVSPTPPLLSLYNEFMPVKTVAGIQQLPLILDIPAGVPMEFRWLWQNSACCEHAYYRYGWDVADLNNPDDWEIALTPFPDNQPWALSLPRTFFSGARIFTVEIVDCHGSVSRIEIKINYLPFTMERPVLVVDDFGADESAGNGWLATSGAMPSDAEHDAFWEDMLSDVAGFNPAVDVIDVNADMDFPLALLTQYRSVIWNVYSDIAMPWDRLPLLYKLIRFWNPEFPISPDAVTTNPLKLFMSAGGHVLITGAHPMTNNINRTYFFQTPRVPMMILYELLGAGGTPGEPDAEASFAYHDLCLDVLDLAILTPSRARNQAPCPVDGIRRTSDAARLNGMRAGIPIDLDFPRIELRPETAGTGKFHEASARGLEAEVYNPNYFRNLCPGAPSPQIQCFQPIYGLECLETSAHVYGEPVAFWSGVYEDVVAEVPGGVAARSAVFGFSPVFFNPSEMKQAMDVILFGEWQLPQIQ